LTWTILFVDDEPLARDLFRMVLERAQFQVIDAKDGLEALAIIKKQKPDAAILDVMMPGMDGFSLCRALRAEPETAALPIIILSARSHESAVDEGMEAGANLYLSKLTPHREIIQRLHSLLETAAAKTD